MGGEIYLFNAYIPEYLEANRFNHETRRPRKLLLHKREVNRLLGAVQREGMTVVPLKVYFNERGRAKVEVALAKRQEAARQARKRARARLAARTGKADAREGLRRLAAEARKSG